MSLFILVPIWIPQCLKIKRNLSKENLKESNKQLQENLKESNKQLKENLKESNKQLKVTNFLILKEKL